MKSSLVILFCIVQSIYSNIHSFNDNGVYRVVGGRNAGDGIAPYICALLSGSGNLMTLCGCTILTDKWVLTAAHCIEGQPIDGATVLVGTNYLQHPRERANEKSRMVYEVSKWIAHHSYDKQSSTIVHDIALVKVQTNIQFNERVKPIKFSSTPVAVGANVQLTGWGRTSQFGEPSNRLQTLNMTIISNKQCGKQFRIVGHHLCAIARFGQGACQGDSGGPLVLNNEVVGVASFCSARGCGIGPSVFSRISDFTDWINEQIE